MFRKLIQLAVTAVLITTGMTIFMASPAAAAGGCTPLSVSPNLGACVDYQGGTNARADFYLNVNPDSGRARYSVVMYVDGAPTTLTSGLPYFNGKGRHCCWYKSIAAMPQRWVTLRVRVNVYTSTGTFHFYADSPTILVKA